ncbi:MAG: transglutaminase N-terminal domain-containing protein, partial [Sulfurimonas sp.]|nr:transglutaminase N-terminal domain-containing protein [Sulfurimonas sp.]
MPRYKIIHRTYYNYSDFVQLGRHSLRLRPRENYELHVNSFTLKIVPQAKLFWHRDVEGNSVAIANFEANTQQLFIESEVILEQFNESPLNFLVADYALSYPFVYEAEERFLLSAYMLLPQETTRTLLNEWI